MSSNHLSPYKIITILLTIFLMLHITSLWLIYFLTGALYLLILLTYFIPHFPSGNQLFSVSMSLFSFCLSVYFILFYFTLFYFTFILFYFIFWPCCTGTWDLISPTRDRTCSGSAESQPVDHQRSPCFIF